MAAAPPSPTLGGSRLCVCGWLCVCDHAVVSCVQVFCQMRMADLYDIIGAMPARYGDRSSHPLPSACVAGDMSCVRVCVCSTPAVSDLQAALRRVSVAGRRRQIATRLIQVMHKRLLHAGTPTTDILRFLVSSMYALRSIDRSGVVLEAASAPVKQVQHHA